jgi:hypothetical protein
MQKLVQKLRNDVSMVNPATVRLILLAITFFGILAGNPMEPPDFPG